MKVKLVVLELEANTAGGTDSLCRALEEVLRATILPQTGEMESAEPLPPPPDA